MARIKTKDGLTRTLDKCLNGQYTILGSEKQKIVEEYREKIDNTLTGTEKDLALPYFSSLDFGKGGLPDFVLQNNEAIVKHRLDVIQHDLYEWLKLTQGEPTKEFLSKSSREFVSRKKKVGIWAFFCVFSSIIIGEIIFFVLNACALVNLPTANNVSASDIIGLLDAVFGISFFLYEFVSDKLSKKFVEDVENGNVENGKGLGGAIEKHIYKVFKNKYTIIGDGNTQNITTIKGSKIKGDINIKS